MTHGGADDASEAKQAPGCAVCGASRGRSVDTPRVAGQCAGPMVRHDMRMRGQRLAGGRKKSALLHSQIDRNRLYGHTFASPQGHSRRVCIALPQSLPGHDVCAHRAPSPARAAAVLLPVSCRGCALIRNPSARRPRICAPVIHTAVSAMHRNASYGTHCNATLEASTSLRRRDDSGNAARVPALGSVLPAA